MTPWLTTWLATGVGAFLLAVALTPVAIRAAHRWQVLDHPGHLKPHERATAYLGGVAVTAAALVAVAAAVLLDPPGDPGPQVWRLVAPVAVAMLLGLADDLRDLPVLPRLGVEVVVGVGLWWSTGADLPWLLVAVPLTVWAINGVNMVDGLDGLAALTTAVTLTVLTTLLQPDTGAVLLGAGFVGALLGFLLYNRPPARIYLGDAGSYPLGTVVAALVLHVATAPGPRFDGSAWWPVALAVGVGIAWFPLAEMLGTVLRRLRSGTGLTTGDRGHSYDRLRDRGLSVPVTVLVAVLATAVGAVAVRLLVPASATLAAVVGVLVVLVGAAASAGRTRADVG